MGTTGQPPSERVVYTVADVLGEDPTELPQLERTISGDALDHLFHREDQLPGAHTVFPYCDRWVVVHSTGSVEVFETYEAASASAQLPAALADPPTTERMIVLHFEDEQYAFHGDQLEDLHRIVSGADDSDEAWEDTVAFARRQAEAD